MLSGVDPVPIGHLGKRLLKGLSSGFYTASQRWPSVARPVLRTILPLLAMSATTRELLRKHIVRFGNLVGYALFEPVPLLNGMTLEIVRGTVDGETIASVGVYEIEVVSMVKRVVTPGMVFLDVGANVGQYTLIASALVGESGRVYAVEPLPQLAASLKKNIQRNGLTNVIVSQLALSDSDEKRNFYASCPLSIGTGSFFKNMYSDGSSMVVQCQKLQTYTTQMRIPHVDVMKLDVEGSELRIIHGSSDMFRGVNAPVLFIEINDYMLRRAGRSAVELLALLQEFDYSVFQLAEGGTGARPLCSTDLAERPTPTAFNALAWPAQRKMPEFIAAVQAGLS